jgi:hypothetical protein
VTVEVVIRKRLLILVVLAGAVVFATWLYSERTQRLGASADVQSYVPADAQAILWIPQIGEFTTQLMSFTRGIQETSLLRDALKPETGVDLGDVEGMRRVGIDPEAGVALVWKEGLAYILLGVEDADALSAGLSAKFKNLGYTVQPPPEDDAGGLYLVYESAGSEHAAFQSRNGLMALTYRVTGDSPSQALSGIFSVSQGSFFTTERYKRLRERVGDKGLMFYLDTDMSDGPRSELSLRSASSILPPLVGPLVIAHLKKWMAKVQFLAGSITLSSCEALAKLTAVTETSTAPLIPKEWVIQGDGSIPKMAAVLPRDTVLFTRLELNVTPVGALIRSLAGFTGGLRGLLGKTDAVASLLGEYVHPDLADRHLIRDVVDQLSGQVGVALLGIDRRAPVNELIDFSFPQRWLNQAQLVFAVEVRDGAHFWDRWWSKRGLLSALGYSVLERTDIDSSVADNLGAIERMCSRKERRTARRKSRTNKTLLPPCERYHVLRRGNMLWITTGAGTIERVLAAIRGDAAPLPGLTREPLATAVFESAHMSLGGYFSFDGLLKSIENRNLPGGATRYLAQMFEFVFRLDVTGPHGDLDLLLTR